MSRDATAADTPDTAGGSSRLDRIFHPASAALVGATGAVHKAGGRRWRTLAQGGFSGSLHPVNPSRRELDGHRAVASARDLPPGIDLAVVAVPDAQVEQVVEDCIAAAVGGIVLITGGFAERGAAGRAVQERLVRQLRAAGIPLIGPNCAGVASPPAGLNAVGWSVPQGHIGLVSQSGNLALEFSRLALERGGGFSRYVSIGNAADVGVAEVARWLLHDPETAVILLYVEGWRDGEARALLDAVRATGGGKPVVILKPGDTALGRRAAYSHTGSLAGEAHLLDAAARQHGLVRAPDAETAWELARLLTGCRRWTGTEVIVVTDGGGHATLLCDELDRVGVGLAGIDPSLRERLAQALPPRCGVDNPIDFAGAVEGEPGLLPRVLEILAQAGVTAPVCIAGHLGGYHWIAGDATLPDEVEACRAVAAIGRSAPFALCVHTIYADTRLPTIEALRGIGLPVSRSMRALGLALEARRRMPTRTSAAPPPPADVEVGDILARAAAADDGTRWLLEPDGRALLARHGIAVPAWQVAATPAAAVDAWQALGGAVVLKAVSRTLLHKSDRGGVLLGLNDADAVEAGARRLLALCADMGDPDGRVLATRQIAGGTELIVGAFRDRHYGPTLMAGAGGVLAEIVRDTVWRFPPVSDGEAAAMLDELRIAPLLHGARGRPGADRASLARLLQALGRLILSAPEIAEIDLNPVFALPDGLAIADARIVLRGDGGSDLELPQVTPAVVG